MTAQHRPSDLPDIDSAEVFLVAPDYFPVPRKPTIPGKTIAKLASAEAQEMARLWGSLPPGEQSRCHLPRYGVRFHARGSLVMKKLRDPGINKVDGLLRSEWEAPSLKKVQANLSTLTPKQKELVRRCVVESIDTAIHDFLFALQERADFEKDIEIRVDGKNVVPLSDGIHGEAFGANGWMAKFSAHGAPPEA